MAESHHRIRRRSKALGLLIFFWFLVLVLLLLAAGTFVEYRAQWLLGGALLIIYFFFRFFKSSRTARIIVLSTAFIIVVRYFLWRTFHTLEYNDPVSFAAAITLYLAEFYGISIFLLGIFVNINPYHRQPVPMGDPEALPTVDVLVPSYNESKDILEVTLLACTHLNYPKEKLRILLLDDGATEERLASPKPEVRAGAEARQAELIELCSQVGVEYLSRANNYQAKAGNINCALKQTTGDLVVIFDADHIPTEDFLEKTVGQFALDEKLFLVQTPHFFTNPDPIEKNLGTFENSPSENEMFYRVVQPGLDFWNGSFFCGSGALLRRSILMENGGFAGNTITEDAETALTLHAKGYNSAYIGVPLLSGMAPDTMGNFIVQRIRWCTGMIQIFLMKNPLLIRGLTLPQRLCYANSCMFWFFPFARLVFFLAPVAFLVFGLKIYATNWQTFTAYAIPHLIAAMSVSSYLYGRVRRSFVSELYELVQAVYCFPALIKTFLNPRAPAFKVTPKGEFLNKTFISPLVAPFYVLGLINLIAIIIGTWRWYNGMGDFAATIITVCFAVFNFVILLASLGALLERKQRRATARMPVQGEGELVIGEHVFACSVIDASHGGAKIEMRPSGKRILTSAEKAVLNIRTVNRGADFHFNVLIRNVRYEVDSEVYHIGLEFQHQSYEEKRQKVRFVTGSSYRWAEFQRSRESRLGVFGSFLVMLWLGVKHSTIHFFFLLGTVWRFLVGRRTTQLKHRET
jgi:cellulose synthase (UDP-forming)